MSETNKDVVQEKAEQILSKFKDMMMSVGAYGGENDLDQSKVKSILKTISSIETLLDVLDTQSKDLDGFMSGYIDTCSMHMRAIRKCAQAELRYC